MPWFENQWLSKQQYPWLFAQDYTLEYETIRYFLDAQNSGTPSTLNPFTVNENIKALKNGSAVTLNSVTMNLSTVNGTAFISNPSVDLRPYLGYVMTLHDGTKTAAATAWQVGTGETYLERNADTGFDTDAYWTKNFGWTITGSKAVGANTTATMYRDESLLTAQALYRAVFTVSDCTANGVRAFVGGGTATQNFTLRVTNETFTEYKTNTNNTVFGLRGADSASTFKVDNYSFSQVLTPSATGLTLGAAGAQNWGTIQSGFNPNATSYILIITRS